MKDHQVNETEIPLHEILEGMKINTYNNFHNYSASTISKEYLKLRAVLFKILQKITMKMYFKSQTFFLSIYYLDILFMKKKKININLYKLGLACLCLSAKYCENDPIVPQLQYFIKIYNNVMGYKNIISMSDLLYTEVLVCKMLNYKLNYYSVYDFNTFFFCHGIFKLEQIKDIENEFKNNFLPNNNDFAINKSFIKNILGKIYKVTRNYLDIVINKYNIIFKYNPIYITILILKKSMEEILGDEFSKNYITNKNNKEKEKDVEIFIKKNSTYFRDIMKDFYKIDYESNEQYKELLMEDEIKKLLFKEKDKKDDKKDENQNNNNNKKNIKNNRNDIGIEDNNKIFNSSAANGFYKRLKIPINDDINNTKKIKNTINQRNANTIIDDIDSNLNINEFRKTQIKTNGKINNNCNKIHISRINTYNAIETHKKTESNDYKKTSTKIKTESNSPNSINPLNYKKFKKKQRINTNKEKTNQYIYIDEGNILNNSKEIKKPYFKKLICLNNNKDIFNSIISSIKSSTATNFYNSKDNSLLPSNTQTGTTQINNSKNFLTFDNSNINNNNNYERNHKNNDENYINSYISSFHRRMKLMNQQNKKKLINTSIGERYRRKIKTNLYGINNIIKVRERDISPVTKNDKSLINENNININTEGYENIKSSTCDNFYPSKLKKISVNLNKDSNMKKQNNELNTEHIPLLQSNRHIFEFNSSSKEINKIFPKSIIDEHKISGCNTSRNDNGKGKLYVNILNEKNKSKQYKKVNYNKIQKKFLLDNINNKNKKKTNNNISLNITKNNNENNKKSIVGKTKNISINIHNNNKPLTKRMSFKNNENKNATEGPLTSRVGQSMIKDQDNFQSSLYKIIKKTKDLFTKNKKEKEDINTNFNNLVKKSQKTFGNNNFYRSQQDFYKNKNNNKDKNSKNKSDIKIKENSYTKNVINKTKAIKDKINYNDKKNNSTIIINNNINISIRNNNKNVKISKLKLNNVIVNSRSNYNINNYNTQRNINNYKKGIINMNNMNNSNNNSRKNINDLNHKLLFNKKIINKNKK